MEHLIDLSETSENVITPVRGQHSQIAREARDMSSSPAEEFGRISTDSRSWIDQMDKDGQEDSLLNTTSHDLEGYWSERFNDKCQLGRRLRCKEW